MAAPTNVNWADEALYTRANSPNNASVTGGHLNRDLSHAANAALRNSIGAFWLSNKATFSDYWDKLPTKEKEALILTVNPTISHTNKQRLPTDFLMPELVLDYLVSPGKLVELCDYITNTHIDDIHVDSLRHMIALKRTNPKMLRPDPAPLPRGKVRHSTTSTI
jgi:hypothetical protein